MKIVQALGWYFPESLGGTEVYVEGLCRRLRSAGHDVLIAAPDSSGKNERTYEHDGVSVFRYPIPNTLTRNEAQGRRAVRGAGRFHDWVAGQKAQIVHFHTLVPGLALPEVKAAKSTGARIIATTHSSSLGYICSRGTMMRWGEQLCDGRNEIVKCAACELNNRGLSKELASFVARLPPGLGRIAGRIPGKAGTALGMSATIAHNRAMQREFLDTVDKFVLLTQWARDAVEANGAPAQKLALNRLGMSQQNVGKKPGPATHPARPPLTIGYLGRFDPIKGVYDFAHAIAAAASPALRFEFRGPLKNSNDRAVLDRMLAIAKNDPRISVAPSVPPSEVPEILAGYDALCCPALCVEGGPTVAIEAHGVGTPVLGTRIGGLAEIVHDGIDGRLVNPGDWKALAEAFLEIARDPAGTLDRWRVALPGARTMDDIAGDYLKLYSA